MSRINLAASLTAALVGFGSSALAESRQGVSEPQQHEVRSVPIIGGTAVSDPAKWADTVAVLGAQGSCTGTLIAPDVVLTAGHCAPVNPTQVKLKTLDYSGTGGITATVKSITAYPNWETTYDVSVIVLTAPVVGVEPRKVATACTYETGWSTNTSVHLVGFGAIDTQAQGANSKLYEVSVPLTDAMCASTALGCKPAAQPAGEFAAGGANKDSCNGDSGGPVYLDTPRGPILVGAVSRATDTSTSPCGDGGIYVRTDKVLEWIKTTTGKTIATDTCLAPPPGDETPDDPTPDDPTDPTNPGGPASSGPHDIVGGCSTGSAGAGLVGIAVALAGLRRRRRHS